MSVDVDNPFPLYDPNNPGNIDDPLMRQPRPPGARVPGVQYPTTANGNDGTLTPPASGPTTPTPIPPPVDPTNDPNTGGLRPPGPTPAPAPNPSGSFPPGMPNPVDVVTGVVNQTPAGIDPRLAALYRQSGLTPGARGSGFADWQYWQDKAGTAGWDYILGRLGSDLAGTGTDQPTGTPGTGPWSNSGRGAPAPQGPRTGPGQGPVLGPIADQPRAPSQVYTGGSLPSDQAIAYLNQINHTLGGQDLTPAQIQEAAQLVGYQEGQPVTSAQINQIVAEMYRRAGRPLPTGPPGQPSPTGPAGPAGPPRPSSPTGNPQGDEFFNLLMRRANQSLDVNPNDPVIRGQTDTYRAEQERGTRNYLSTEAERRGSTGNIEAQSRSMAERGAQATGSFEAQLMGQELQARRLEIQQALSGAQGLLTTEQQMALQRELQQLTIASQIFMQGRQLTQQEAEFIRMLQERGFEFDTTQYNQLGLM